MAKAIVPDVQLVLTRERYVSGILCKPGFLMLEGILASGVTAADVDKAIKTVGLEAMTDSVKKNSPAAGSGSPTNE